MDKAVDLGRNDLDLVPVEEEISDVIRNVVNRNRVESRSRTSHRRPCVTSWLIEGAEVKPVQLGR